MKTLLIDINLIKPYEKNAKTHTEEQITSISESIKMFGFVQPIVIDAFNNVVIGHCRLLAAKRLKLAEVPVLQVTDLSEEEINALRVADNKLNKSPWDIGLVVDQLKELPVDLLNLTGFDDPLLSPQQGGFLPNYNPSSLDVLTTMESQ